MNASDGRFGDAGGRGAARHKRAREGRILRRQGIHGRAAAGAGGQMLIERPLIGGGDFAVDAGGDEVGGGFAVHTAFGVPISFSRSICLACVSRALIVAAEQSSSFAKSSYVQSW